MHKIKNLVLLAVILAFIACDTQEIIEWNPAPNPLMTKWAADIDPAMPWPEYPRPQMVREEWMNLNGLWDYQLVKAGNEPGEYMQKILVPYPVESALSGIADSVGPDDMIMYRRMFELPGEWEEKRILLNFEAVDWETTVILNGQEVGIHKGGYDPFTIDITDYLLDDENELVVKVKDPTSEGYQARGKQVLNPHGIWYTPTSGIWQTVWLEAVSEIHIQELMIISHPEVIVVDLTVYNWEQGDIIKVEILDENTIVKSIESEEPIFKIEMFGVELKHWSPETPFLYDIEISLTRDGVIHDELKSYFGIRTIEAKMADDGYVRLFLNDEVVFQNGTLDQGFWPDGLYTPPTDEAMKYDIQVTKDLGFNMLRKHVKVENRRFYYWCDKLGIMVWQDMPSTSGYIGWDKPDLERPQHEVDQFKFELQRMIETKYNHPSIVMWVPFNEGWGQFDTEGIVDFIWRMDDQRLINNTSGWADRGVGDVIDIHHYPEPRCPEPESERASVLGEFGGLGLYVEGHTWQEKNWGYKKMDDPAALIIKYAQFYDSIWQLMENNGLAACVYTQTTDVETETNGLMTYDREVVKMDKDLLFGLNTNDYKLTEIYESTQSQATKKHAPAYYAPFDRRYNGGGHFALIDGVYGSLKYDDGKWQGFRNNGMDVVIDLGSVKKISNVTGSFLENHEGWTFLPKTFQVFTSNDMQDFALQGEKSLEIPSEMLELAIKKVSVENLDVEARYVRVKASTAGPAPEWLEAAKGSPTWMFIDEIIIE